MLGSTAAHLEAIWRLLERLEEPALREARTLRKVLLAAAAAPAAACPARRPCGHDVQFKAAAAAGWRLGGRERVLERVVAEAPKLPPAGTLPLLLSPFAAVRQGDSQVGGGTACLPPACLLPAVLRCCCSGIMALRCAACCCLSASSARGGGGGGLVSK
jgi:hypothetical protein